MQSRSTSLSRPAIGRAMFSKPLAYPSTLDRLPPLAHSAGSRPSWRGFGARAHAPALKIRTLKRTPISSVAFPARLALEAFLSQAGPRFVLDPFQAGHHLCSDVDGCLQKRRRRPLGSPSTGLDAARKLACMPPSEGADRTAHGPLIEAMPARSHRRGRRRFGGERVGVGVDQHRSL